jgi:hypothetical protein
MKPTGSRPHPLFVRLLFVPSLLASLALAAPASAQNVAAAEALFNRGLADLDAGRYDAACSSIASSQRLDPRPGTLFTLAVCEAHRGRVATAVTHFGDYLSAYEQMSAGQKARQKERAQQAKTQRAQLLPQVPEETLVLPPDTPTGTVVRWDGVLMTESALGVGLPVDPGEHVVTTQTPDGPVWQLKVNIDKGEKGRIPLEVKSLPPPKVVSAEEKSPQDPKDEPAEARSEEKPSPPTDKAGDGTSGQRVAAYVVGGLGIAGLTLGGVMGMLTLREKENIKDHCGAGINSNDEEVCDQAGLDAVDRAKPLALTSTIGLAVGGAAIGAAVVMLLTEPKQKAAAARPAAARWMTADALHIAPTGVVFGVRGGW